MTTHPPAPSRAYVVGDLHGCYHEALDLLEAVGPGPGDRVIFAGDLVDRGPFPRECVELAMRFEAVLGNHEDKHLRQRHRPRGALLPDHRRTLEALGEEHLTYLETLPTSISLPEHGAAVVHAGGYPSIPVEAQDRYHLLHIQCIEPPRPKSHWPSKAPATATFWARLWRGPERLVFGHTVLDRPFVSEHAIGIDTGCVHGGPLTAVELPSGRIVSVPSRTKKSDRRDEPPRFEILEGIRCWS